MESRPTLPAVLRLTGAIALLAGCAVGASAQQPTDPQATRPVVPVAPTATTPLPAKRWTDAQIRQAFDLADGDSNGELTRAEAQRVPIMPRNFEDMDENKDGVLTRTEFEAAFPR